MGADAERPLRHLPLAVRGVRPAGAGMHGGRLPRHRLAQLFSGGVRAAGADVFRPLLPGRFLPRLPPHRDDARGRARNPGGGVEGAGQEFHLGRVLFQAVKGGGGAAAGELSVDLLENHPIQVFSDISDSGFKAGGTRHTMKILMNHLPKCAGNAVAQHFKTLFGESAIYEVRTNGGLDAVPDLTPYRFVFGHLPFRWEEKLGQGYERFSIMRDPVDRVLSAYFFFAQLKEANSPVVAGVEMMSLEEYVTSSDPRIKATTCNEQARQLLGLEGPGPQDPQEAIDFVAKRTHLLDRFFSVGVYERLQESLDVVSWHLHLPRLRSGIIANRTHRNWKEQRFGADILEAIRVRNLIDLELYRIVSDRFNVDSSMVFENMLSKHYFENFGEKFSFPYVVDMAQPVAGSGWYGVQTDARGPYRWMGGRDGASIYFPVQGGGPITVTVHLNQIIPVVKREEVSVYLNGTKIPCVFQPGEGGKIVLVARAESVPYREGHVVTLYTKTWRQPNPQDGRTLALAVAKIELTRG